MRGIKEKHSYQWIIILQRNSQGQKKLLAEAEERKGRVTETLSLLNNRLKNADYALKRLAIEALDVTVTVETEGRIKVLGSIPQEVQLSCANSWHAIM